MLFPMIRKGLFALEAERAHGVTIAALEAWGRTGAPLGGEPPSLPIRVAGLDFPNPVGLAAGVDKDARAVAAWHALGFGSVEAGTLTPLPQPGNPRPRIFRLPEDRGVINRLGFNNGGLAAGLARVPAKRRGVLGINVGANKDAADRIADYVTGVTRAAPLADYVTINISSPNTPGLRDLQQGAALDELLVACVAARGTTPLFLKVAPDLDPAGIDGVARAVIARGVDALIGGLSGGPLAPLARERLADFRSATGGEVPLIAVGGIGSAEEAYARIRAGASLVQLYTALVYEGPGLARRIVRGLATLLERDGFADVAEAVGR